MVDKDGRRTGAVVAMRDITEQRRAEKALLESEDKLRLLLDSTAEAIYGVDLQGRCSFCNRASLRLLGYEHPDELLGKNMHEQIHHSHADGKSYLIDECQIFRAFWKEESTHADTEVFWRKDCTSFPAEYWSYPQRKDGKVVGAVVTFLDITERKQAEQVQRQLTAILEATPDFVGFASAKDGQIVYMNRAGRTMLGIGQDEDVTKLKISDMHPDWTMAMFANEVFPATMKDGIWKGECAFLGRDGREVPVSMVLLCHKSPSGEVELFSTISRDISDQKRTSQKLKDYADALEATNRSLEQSRVAAEAANRAKSRFLANMSHEIRTPMTAILGYANLLMDPTLGASGRNNYLAVIRRNGEHLLTLINDILDLSKIEAGKMSWEMTRCNIVALLADVASTVRPRVTGRDVSLMVEYPGEVPETILTDGAHLRQAVMNLAGNAVKFTQRGSVRIAASFLPEWRQGQPAMKIEVIDTGIGIREEVLSQLFEPFVQGDTSVSQKFGGTGLGLAISRHIVQTLGGELTATSVFGQGSDFSLIVPTGNLEGVPMLRQPAEMEYETADNAEEETGENLEGVRILVAEDGYDNQRLIEAILKKVGAEVETVENGRLALAKAESKPFDLILMDMNMPEMDGYEATRTLRDHGYAKPILALTANAMSEDSRQCVAAGCNEYMAKPINQRQLIQTIARHVGKAAAAGEAKPGASGSSPAVEDGPIVSRFADDPEIAEILGGFVKRLAAQVEAMRTGYESGRHDDLRRLAHRLKGAGGSYGYPSLTEACGALEEATRSSDQRAEAAALDAVAAISEAIQRGYAESICMERAPQ